MSSGRFETELRVDERLRRLVLYSGALSLLTGSVLILHLPLSPVFRFFGVGLWVWQVAREFCRQTDGANRVHAWFHEAIPFGGGSYGDALLWSGSTNRVRRLLISSDGEIVARGRGGAPERLRLLPGSVVLERLAWLRLGFADGSHYGELLAGDPRSDAQWHGLQLVWRQRRGAFGRTG